LTTLLTSADYPSIRAAIETTLDSATLPDAIIALDLYVGAGMRDVLLIDPLAESRTGTALLHAQTAAILFTASRLVGALPQITLERFPDHEYRRREVDPQIQADTLRTRAEAELDAYLDVGDLFSTRPTRFTVATGRRGHW